MNNKKYFSGTLHCLHRKQSDLREDNLEKLHYKGSPTQTQYSSRYGILGTPLCKTILRSTFLKYLGEKVPVS